MEKSNLGKSQPTCTLAHSLTNQLTVIIGFCDLIQEGLIQDPECLERVSTIRKVAAKMADDLNRHQCELDAITEMLVKQLPDSAKAPRFYESSPK